MVGNACRAGLVSGPDPDNASCSGPSFSRMRQLLFLFVDGIGLGPASSDNPFAAATYPALERLGGDQPWLAPFSSHGSSVRVARPIDATLGVEGLPQSGTGQAALLTGINCPRIVGRHFGPFPHSKTHPTLDAHNLFRQVHSLADPPLGVSFANAFPPRFFRRTRRRTTVTTYCCRAAGVPLRDLAALRDRQAITADLTGHTWRTQLGLDVPARSVSDTADILLGTARTHALTLFEYFLTDKAGHRRIDTPPAQILGDLDQLVGTLTDQMDPERDTLLLTSDHGNLEAGEHTQHTRNPVPLLVYGWAAPHFAEAADLTDVTPGIVRALRTAHIVD